MSKALFLSAIVAAGLFGTDPAAREVKSVYIMRMSSALDQYLASELTKSGFYTVTTDPQKADALFTDALGEGFEKRFKDLYPPPAGPAPAKTDATSEEKKDDKKDGILGEPVQRVGSSSLGRAKGAIFLVDRKSRNLLWSMNRQPKSTTAKDMVDQARKVVDQLKKDLGIAPATK